MVIAALETATRAGSVALATDDICVSRLGDPARPHGDRLPAELTDWVTAHGRTLDDLDLLAVVSGPGSFTGLRVGIATVQGLAFGRGLRVLGISTLEALAAGWRMAHPDASGLLVACLEGHRGEVFSAAWADVGLRDTDSGTVVLEPSAGSPEDLGAALAAVARSRDVTIVGDGAIRHADVLARALPGARLVEPALPLAEVAARLARRRQQQATAPHALRPIYIRRPDAEVARERKRREPSPYVIRRIDGREDLSAVEALQRQTFANPWGADAIRWELENTDVARLYVMQDAAGAVVAYCACWMVLDELHINSLAVDGMHRRRGLARRLLEHVLDEAVAAGAMAATLEVRTSNEAARTLYEGLGFAVEGIRRDYYQDPREDAILLWNRNLRAQRTAGRGQRAEGRGQR